MTPAVRWGIGIVLFLIAGALWMFWNAPHNPKAPTDADAAKQPAAATTQPAAGGAQLASMPTPGSAVAPAATPAPAPPPAAAPVAPKAAEPVMASVLFDFDHSQLRAGEVPKLDELAARIKSGSFERLDAVGHADRIGEEPYNAGLSRKRADAVVAYFVGKGVDAKRIHAGAKGESETLTGDACMNMGPESATNQKLIECLQRDRRVEIKFVVAR